MRRVAGDDLSTFGDPDHLVLGARDGQEPTLAAEGDAVGRHAIERMEGVDRGGLAALFAFEWEGSEFEIGVGKDAAQGGRGDKLGVAAPGVVPGVDPALQVFDLCAVDGKCVNGAMLLGFGSDKTHRRDAEGPEEQTEGNAENHGNNHTKVAARRWVQRIHGVLLTNRDTGL